MLHGSWTLTDGPLVNEVEVIADIMYQKITNTQPGMELQALSSLLGDVEGLLNLIKEAKSE